MSFRNRKFPFTGSMGVDTSIAAIAVYAMLAVALTHFGQPLARYAPGILTYFSFQDYNAGSPGWNYSFDEGWVGPFHVGQNKSEVRDSIAKCGCFSIYPRTPQSALIRPHETTPASIDGFLSGKSLLISKNEAGSFVCYELFFEDDKLLKVRTWSYLLGDL